MADPPPPKLRRTVARQWPALVITAARIGDDDLIAAVLDDFSPAAIEDLAVQPLPPGGLWDPTYPPPPEPPPAPTYWRVFFHDVDARSAAEGALRHQFPGVILEPLDVADEDWAARSQKALTAIRAGAFIVAPPWDRPKALEPGLTTIIVEPSRGFGTGHHATTRLCLKALSDVDVTGKRVLDLGTGSGVLAMAAALKGAREVHAVDVDPDAIEAAHESAALNQLPIAIAFAVSDFRSELTTGGGFEVLLANLTGGMLTSSATKIAELIAPGGLLVISGFDESERALVRAAFAALTDLALLTEDGWVALVLRTRTN